MDELKAAQAAVDRARRELAASVRRARSQGRTWADIGRELGMSRQAAFKRFGEPVDPRTGARIPARSVRGISDLTERVFALIATGDHAALAELMHPTTAEELPASLIDETWRKVLTEVGSLERCVDTRVELPGGGTTLDEEDDVVGTVVGATVLECEAGRVQGRVAVDDQSLVVGLLLVPVGHTPLPF